MKLSENGLKFLKDEEGFRPTPYKDSGGALTIGFGHKILEGESFTSLSIVEATDLLEKDILKAETCIINFVREPLNQNEFDSLTSFIFNIGCAQFKGSTMLKLLNIGDFDSAAEQFPRWCKDNGKIIKALLNRRLREKAMFLRSM